MQKTCAYCNVLFYTEDRSAKYCSRTCYQSATGRPEAHNRTCEVCGASYTAYDSHAKYCSQNCYNSIRKLQTRECECCHTIFEPKRKGQRFCSVKCVNFKLPDAECAYCGSRFHPRTTTKNKFCSLECYHASMASNYPRSRLNFSAREKNIILKRDNYQCVICGATDNLEIDHIIAVCNGGKRSIANGQTLCVSCHDKKTVIDKAIARIRHLDLRQSNRTDIL